MIKFNNNRILLVIASICIILSGMYFVFKKNKIVEQKLFKTENPKRKDLIQYVKASGTLQAKDQISIGSLVAGKVDKILVDNNDFVKKGQVLAILDNGIGDNAVKRTKAELRQAEENLDYYQKFYKRQTELFKANQISKDLFEQQTKNLEVLKEQVKQIKATLKINVEGYNNLFIKSPENGVVIAKEINLGQMITSRLDATVLFIIAKDLKCMEAHVDVDEADVGLVKEKQDVTFTVDSFPFLHFDATVKQIRYLAKIVDNIVTYATILDVANPDLKLRPGMTTNVEIKVAQAKNSIVVLNKTLRINSKILKKIAKELNYGFERIKNETISKTKIHNLWILEGQKFKQLEVKLGAKEGKYTQILNKNINENTKIVSEIAQIDKENLFLKQFFSKPGTIGEK
ncbi:efflux RND transporter periplasmic adaptor subunit [Candidatus Babeliales bacterium]|nr:efflux RND transporter periplasmic adaptor subunit [Candidatus Babeliales bacterium]